LECELLDRVPFRTPKEARTGVFDFIEGWYNPRRRHSALDYDSPLAFERRYRSSIPFASTIEPATDQTCEGDTSGGATS